MALIRVSPPTAILEDGDNERLAADLEEGEIEDGELDDVQSCPPVLASKEQVVSKVSLTIPLVPPKKEKNKDNATLRSVVKRRSLHHHHPERNKDSSEPEDEWAGVVEKAIKRAMAKDSASEKSESVQQASVCEKQDTERKYKRKKRRKKHRDEEEEERKDVKKRKRNHQWLEDGIEGSLEDKTHEEEDGEDEEEEEEDEEEEDDDEMLFVRGASPIMKNNYGEEDIPQTSSFIGNPYSFNDQGMPYDDTYDSYNEEESDYENRDFTRCNSSACEDEGPKRGMGRGIKRRQRGMGRVISHNKRQGRKENKSKRGGSKRQQQMRNNADRGSDCICMFYMQGKCQKGDDCPYSHNALPPRKMELCKFYLMDCCAKKDKCLYMHHDFPCKFHHTGLKCFSGPRCKFSHGHLTDTMRAVLLKHLETAPKEILGDFPRLSREGAAAMVYSKKNRGNKLKKIPSLFDIEVPIPAQLLAEQKEANEEASPSRRTPMPESDNEESERVSTPVPLSPDIDVKLSTKLKGQRWSDEESCSHEPHTRESNEEFENDKKDESNFTEQLEEFNVRRYRKTLRTDDLDKKKEDNFKKDGRLKQELNLHKLAGYSPNPPALEDENKYFDGLNIQMDSNQEKVVKYKEIENKEEIKHTCESVVDFQKDSQPEAGESGADSNDDSSIPLHLPKKQRELFRRIQHKQREANSSRDQSGDDDDNMNNQQEENWYSSDEEEESLTNVLKNLSRQEQQNHYKEMESKISISTSVGTCSTTDITAITTAAATSATTVPGSFDKLKLPDLSQIDISESVSKLLSSIRRQHTTEDSNIPAATSIVEQSTPFQQTNTGTARDPRLQRDPRNRSQTSSMVTASAAVVVTASATIESTTSVSTATTSTTNNILSSPSSLESGHTRRSDPRRTNDPRSSKSSHRTETSDHRHLGGSISTRRGSGSTPPFTSIYSNAITSPSLSTRLGVNLTGQFGGGSDTDLRKILSRKDLETSVGDIQQGSRTDMDLREVQQTSLLSYGDTDLRLKAQDFMSGQLFDDGRPNGDVDLRRILELPFKPVPMHTPATEIDASLTSHPPIPYKVVVVTIPRPDYTSLKLSTADPQVQCDPRLRKIFKLSATPSSSKKNSNLSSTSRSDPRRQTARNSGGSYQGAGVVANTDAQEAQVPISADRFSDFPAISSPKPQKDIIMANTQMLHSTIIPAILPNLAVSPQNSILPNFDPRIARNPRHAPGILGPAPLLPNYCPTTPMFEEQENSNGSDNNPRMFYNRGNPMEMGTWEQHSQHSQRNSWRNSRRNQQQRYMEQEFGQRSYTPPA